MKLLRQGLELLRANDSISEVLSEMLLSKKFPPLFLKYLTLFKVGVEGRLRGESVVLYDSNMDKFGFAATYQFENELIQGQEYEMIIGNIFDYSKLNSEYAKYKDRTAHEHKFGLIRFADFSHSDDMLCIGVEDHNLDEIWRYGPVLEDQTNKLANDIFEFMGKLKQYICEEDLEEYEIDTSQLYKNWGEDFWRVRRDEQA